MRTCHLKDSQILLNQKSRRFRPLSCLFFSQSDTGSSLLHCHELFGRTKSRFSYESSLTIVESLQKLNHFMSPVLMLILLMECESGKALLSWIKFSPRHWPEGTLPQQIITFFRVFGRNRNCIPDPLWSISHFQSLECPRLRSDPNWVGLYCKQFLFKWKR